VRPQPKGKNTAETQGREKKFKNRRFCSCKSLETLERFLQISIFSHDQRLCGEKMLPKKQEVTA
jgi:hypothetical protein